MKYNRIYSAIMGCAVIAMLVACDSQTDNLDLDDRAIRFDAAIRQPATRATDNAFDEGDRISVYAFNHNRGFDTSDCYARNIPHNYQAGVFSAESGASIVYPTDGSGLAFYAIYPYQTDVEDSFTFSVHSDQSSPSNYTASDLMTAKLLQTAELSPLLSFSHRMAGVQLRFNMNAQESIKSVEARNVQTSVAVNLNAHTFLGTGQPTGSIVPVHRVEKDCYQLVLPQQIIAEGTDFIVITTSAGKEYTWKVPRNLELLSGCRHAYRLDVAHDGIITLNAAIDPWEEESTNPPVVTEDYRIKTMVMTDVEAEETYQDTTRLYYDDQNRLVRAVTTVTDDPGIDELTISYSERSVTMISKEESYNDNYKSEVTYQLDENGYVVQCTSLSYQGDQLYAKIVSNITYQDGYISGVTYGADCEPAVSANGARMTWENGKLAKVTIDLNNGETEEITFTYPSILPGKLLYNDICYYFSDVADDYVGELGLISTLYYGKGLEPPYDTMQRNSYRDEALSHTVKWTRTYEVNEHGYVSKILDSYDGKHNLTIEFEYEEIPNP